MSKERLEEFKDYIDFLDDSQGMQDHGRFVDTLHSLYEDGWFDWIYLHAKEQDERVKEYEYRYNKHLDLDIKNHDKIRQLEQQIKRYRELLTSRSMKQLIRLEDKGCFLPDEGREGFLDLKYAVEELEGEE